MTGDVEAGVAARFAMIRPYLDERQRRLWLGTEAVVLGRGGVAAVARATGAAEPTVRRGRDEIENGVEADGPVRGGGGGRPSVEQTAPDVVSALEALVAPGERGDPVSPLRWTTESTAGLSAQLGELGFEVGPRTVARLLHEAGYSLRANVKTVEGRQHPDRDAQFRHVNDTVAAAIEQGQPAISVDTKKKELVGNFANKGRAWRPKGEPTRVNVHDFMDKDLGKAIPYGVYDLGANTGWVTVGSDHDTAAFAVNTIRSWWRDQGKAAYPDATTLTVTCDSGGSNGSRLRAWKTELAKLAAETGLDITVRHLPPGTSKWNRIEHRLFSAIAMNWRGHPLTSHEVILELIASTTTKTGLTVTAHRDEGRYPTGVKISNAELAAVPITRDDFHGEWNYTIHPRHTRESDN